jgi:nitrogen-specific signal transduction histidine kinase
VWLEIRDTGSGVDPAIRERMFEPYASTRAIGRGLGLTAALGVVRGHAGGLTIDSTSGRGTRVRVIFPVAE